MKKILLSASLLLAVSCTNANKNNGDMNLTQECDKMQAFFIEYLM